MSGGTTPPGFRLTIHYAGFKVLCFDAFLEVLILLELAIEFTGRIGFRWSSGAWLGAVFYVEGIL